MFETVSPEALIRRNRARFVGTLPVSLVAHGLLIGGAMMAAAWNVRFPVESPRLMSLYSVVQEPPPPPPPPPPPAPRARVVPIIETVPQPVQPDLAPTFIPDEIPVLVMEPQREEPAGVEGGVEGGIEGGEIGGVIGGTEGGVVGGEIAPVVTAATAPIVDGRVIVPRDAKLRMTPLSMVYPDYPEYARQMGWEDQLVVRYVIGKDGRVRSVSVVRHAERNIFEPDTVKAIRNWRFRPLIRDGEAREVVHELTVIFKLEAEPLT
jgi:protein TonB